MLGKFSRKLFVFKVLDNHDRKVPAGAFFSFILID